MDTRMLPWFAPLTEEMMDDLVVYREKSLVRDTGRPPREAGDKVVRFQRRLQLALEVLVPEVAQARQRVFELMQSEINRSGRITRRWLLVDILYPPPHTPYQERITDWHRENLLLFERDGELEPSSTAAILVLRELVHRKRWLPPPPPKPRSFYCFRYDRPGGEPVPYELPLAPVNESYPSALKPTPTQGPSPYVLWTPWKGVAWDDETWLVYNEGAIRWVGDPTEDTLARWLSPQEQESLSVPGDAELEESRARRSLRILASQLSHNPSSGNTT
jgi:hypothetical protein